MSQLVEKVKTNDGRNEIQLSPKPGATVVNDKAPRIATFGAWCEATTTHGVADAWGDSLKCGRVFFLCLVLIMLAMGVFQIVMLISSFCTPPYFDSTVVMDQEEYSLFPNITVCNQNRINNTKVRE
jgi:hypothetical protein